MAPVVTNALVITELTKFKKQELIDLIVFQKLPVACENNPVLCEVKNRYLSHKKYEETEFFDRSEIVNMDTICVNFDCIKVKAEIDILKNKVDFLTCIKVNMEERINEQKELICSLKLINDICQKFPVTSTDNTITDQTSSVPNNIQKPTLNTSDKYKIDKAKTTVNKIIDSNQNNSATNNTLSHRPNKRKQNSDKKNSPHKNETTEDQLVLTQKNNRNNRSLVKRNTVIGTNKTTNSSVKCIPKLGYLHVYRLAAETTENDIKKFLQQTAPNIHFTCEKLIKKDPSSASFKISFPLDNVEHVYEPSIWPVGAAVRRYRFPKRNFSAAEPQIQLE